jgi:hypothetical protein
MSVLGADDREKRSYLELVDILRQHGATPVADMLPIVAAHRV